MLKKFLTLLVMLYATLAMAAVEVNKATDAQLDSVKGIGPVTSKLIMTERKKGDFKNWQDFIDRVKGIGEARAEKLSSEGLTVNGTAYKAAATKKDDKAAAKEEKKEAKAAAKEEKKDAKMAAKDEKKDVKADAAKPVASASKTAASAAKPAASAKK